MTEPDLSDLLNIMRQMHIAASCSQWDSVDELDAQRLHFLDQVRTCPSVAAKFDSSAIREIIELDQAVMLLANQGLEIIAQFTRAAPVPSRA